MTDTMIDPRTSQPMIAMEGVFGRVYHETQREQELDAAYKEMCRIATLRGMWIEATTIAPERDAQFDEPALYTGLTLASGSTTPTVMPGLIEAATYTDAMVKAQAMTSGVRVAVFVSRVS